jgi:hypothetical protein
VSGNGARIDQVARDHDSTTRRNHRGTETLELLADLFYAARFPCDREHLLAAGVMHHTPPVLLQVLCALPRDMTWPDAAAVIDELDCDADPHH